MKLLKTSNDQIFLESLLDEIDEYFHLMGGARCYSGFSDWHVPALLLLLLVGVDPTKEEFFSSYDSHTLSPRMWRETDGLPSKIFRKLDGFKLSHLQFELYLKVQTERIARKLGAREILAWSNFLAAQQDRFRRFI
jgi:hypothetical protein